MLLAAGFTKLVCSMLGNVRLILFYINFVGVFLEKFLARLKIADFLAVALDVGACSLHINSLCVFIVIVEVIIGILVVARKIAVVKLKSRNQELEKFSRQL